MKKGWSRLLFVAFLAIFSTISVSFAGKYDGGNAELINTLTQKLTNGVNYQNFNQEQKNEVLRELGTLQPFAQTYPQDQNTQGAYQQYLLQDWMNKEVSPYKRSLNGDLKQAPRYIEEVTQGIINQIVANGVAGSSGILDTASGGAGPVTTQASALDNARNETDRAADTTPSECSINPIYFDLLECVDAFFNFFVKNVLLNIAGIFLWISANILNYSISIGILNFKDWAPPTLYPIWVIIRQAVSLVMVFVGLYLGGMYILGREDKFEKYIPWVIMFALFVNFSYPLTRTMVDISNIISLKVYTAAVGTEVLNPNLSDKSSHTAGAIITDRMGFSGLITSAGKPDGKTNSMLKSLNSTPASLAAVCLILYASYVFFMATIFIAGRTVMLVFLTVASPLLFVDSVLPLLGDRAMKLRKLFFEQLAVGPVFMVMLALTLKFLEVFSNGPLHQVPGDTIKTFFNLVMMLIMLQITLKVTKSFSGEVGNWVTQKLGTVGGFALGVGAAGTGMLARAGIGRLATKARDSAWVKNNQDGFIGRRAYNLTNSLANSTFDLRNSSVVAGATNRLGMSKGMGFSGKGAAGGYQQRIEAKNKDILDRASRIETRYADNVYDDKGNLIHKKGDVNEEGEQAMNRYVATAGGNRFMTKAEKEKVRTMLAEKADTESQKRIADEKAKAQPDIDLYKSIKDDPNNEDGLGLNKKERKSNFKKQLEDELKNMSGATFADIKAGKVMVRNSQEQSLFQSIKAIEDMEKDEKVAFDRRITSLVTRYNNMEGVNEAEIKKSRDKLINSLEDDDVRSAVLAQVKQPAPAPATQTTAQANNQPRVSPILDQNGNNFVVPAPAAQPSKTPTPSIASVGAASQAMMASKTAQGPVSQVTQTTTVNQAPVVNYQINLSNVKQQDFGSMLAGLPRSQPSSQGKATTATTTTTATKVEKPDVELEPA